MVDRSTSERYAKPHPRAGLPVAVPQRPAWKRWLILILGWLFIVLGVLGLFLPFLQGFLFLFVGFVLLAREQAWARRLVDRLRQRYPKFAHQADQAELWAKQRWHRLTHSFRRR